MFGAALIGIAKEQHYSAKLSTAKDKRSDATPGGVGLGIAAERWSAAQSRTA